MNRQEYEKTTLAEMQKSKWRTTRVLINGNMEIPIGTVVEITQKRGGLNLRAEKCSHCGVVVYITKVFASSVERVV